MSKRLRAFFGLPVPEAAKPMLTAAITRMQIAAHGSHPAARWQPEHKLHTTLKFLGWVESERLPELWAMAVERARNVVAIRAELAEVTAFRSLRHARVIVVSVADLTGNLRPLASELEAGAEALGFEREAREYRPHVTLARLKNPGNVSRWVDAAAFAPEHVEFDQLCLYRSDLGSEGGVYTVIERLALKG